MQMRIAAAVVACAIAAPTLAAPDINGFLDDALAGAGVSRALADGESDPVLRFDIQQVDYALNGDGALSEGFTGTISLSFGAFAVLNSVEGGDDTEGPFGFAGDGGALSAFAARITLDGGFVTGGSIDFANDLGDSLSIDLDEGGRIRETAALTPTFSIDGIFSNARFDSEDQLFGDVSLSKFYSDAGPLSDLLIGDLLLHQIRAGGTLDAEILVTVPTPGAAAIIGLGGLVMSRRRR